jgi:hypothetical protein
MFIVKSTVLSGRRLTEKLDNAQDALHKAERWLAAGFIGVCLCAEGGLWHYGREYIRLFIDSLSQVAGDPLKK